MTSPWWGGEPPPSHRDDGGGAAYIRVDGLTIHNALVRIEGQVGRMADQATGHAADLADHEARIRLIEEVRTAPRLADLAADVRELKARQWPLPTLGLLISAAALLVAILPKLTS